MSKGRLLYAQSGGVTAVINASASAVLAQARARKIPVYAGKNGILGILREQMFDTAGLTAARSPARHTVRRQGLAATAKARPSAQRSSRQYSQRSPRRKNCLPAIAAEALK